MHVRAPKTFRTNDYYFFKKSYPSDERLGEGLYRVNCSVKECGGPVGKHYDDTVVLIIHMLRFGTSASLRPQNWHTAGGYPATVSVRVSVRETFGIKQNVDIPYVLSASA